MRNSLYRLIILCAMGTALLAPIQWPQTAYAGGGTPLSPEESRNELKEGNARFQKGSVQNPRRDTRRRLETARAGQSPIALVLACSDSREAVELLFDQGLGDLFVVRVAGNTTGVAVLGSIEYAVEHLNVPLIVVLGHTQCGAVDSVWQGGETRGNLAGLLAPMMPVIRKVKEEYQATGGDERGALRRAVAENVRVSTSAILAAIPFVANRVAEKKLLVLGAVYDLETGAVSWLDAGARAENRPSMNGPTRCR